ncbi:hypothetical protein [Lactococcus lactis]|uniref:Uncharacterized protein n=1 Tax=Lactococcus lactis TaxID=1358 RepID=A0AAW5TIX2_9LACT|nr:hypothetical protein [Lactococcus lactis]MCW2279906.1 hypothetical protein [Lactococcus lactis]
MLNIKSAKFFIENIENSSANPDSFFKELYFKSFSKPIHFISESRNTISDVVLRGNSKFYNKIPLDSKDEFSKIENDVKEDNELNKTLKEFREDIYKLSHNLIAPFSSKKFLAESIMGGIIQYVMFSNDVPPIVKLITGVILSYFLYNSK